jgi:2-polyprenyl-3-methyl-5-hydroxy-6-metoxy-1,4-benzoquinol methylase
MSAALTPAAVSYTIADQERMAAAVNYFAWQARLVKPYLGRRVMEIGCGCGNFTRNILDREAVLALDTDHDCLDRIRHRFPGQNNLRSLLCDADDLRSFDEARSFQADSIVCLNVLEHIEDDRGAVASMASLLPPGGLIVLIVPAFPSLYGPIDRKLDHFRRYRRASMMKLANDCSLEIKKLHYMNFAGFFGWWFNARIAKREIQSAAQIAFYDKMIVPILSRLEAAVAPPFGQSLFAVFRKP